MGQDTNSNNSELTPEQAQAIAQTMKEDLQRKQQNRQLIDQMYPAMGKMLESYKGSQSTAPSKEYP